MRTWHDARAFVLEVDCNLVISSVSAFVVGMMMLVESTVLMLVLAGMALSSLRTHALVFQAEEVHVVGIVMAGAWATSSVYCSARRLLKIHEDTAQTLSRLKDLRFAAIDTIGTGGCNQATHTTLFLRELEKSNERDATTPIILGLNVKPNLLNAIDASMYTSGASASLKIGSTLIEYFLHDYCRSNSKMAIQRNSWMDMARVMQCNPHLCTRELCCPSL